VRSKGLRVPLRRGVVSARTRAMIRLGLYERAEIAFVAEHLPSHWDVVELGASLGIVSAHIAAKLSPKCRLLCVEGNSKLRPLWLEAMSASTGATLLNYVVGQSNEAEVPFAVSDDPLCSRVGPARGTSERVVAVSQRTLSWMLAENELRGPYSLVADIEGGEGAFIVGDDVTALDNCVSIVIELHDTTVNGQPYAWEQLLSTLIEQRGFHLRAQNGPVVALDRRTNRWLQESPAGTDFRPTKERPCSQ
jgi:FkbM family methyltransferase